MDKDIERLKWVVFEFKGYEFAGYIGKDYDGSDVIWMVSPSNQDTLPIEYAKNIRVMEIKNPDIAK